MSRVQEIAEEIHPDIDRLKSGTLRIFGEWFGKPHDNVHTVVSVRNEGESLVIGFNDGEELKVWSPERLAIGAKTFKIGKAARVRWEWFAYGRPKVAENRFFLDYKAADGAIQGESNVDWYEPLFATSPTAPAVELV
jgi:hypothetical protein